MKSKIIVIVIIIISVAGFFVYKNNRKNNNQNNTNNAIGHPNPCLADDEYADYPIDEKYHPDIKFPKEDPLAISIKNKEKNELISRFSIENIRTNYHPIEIHKCGIYFVKLFNYDSKKSKQDIGYKDELWKFNYKGEGEPLVLLSEKPKEFISYYSPDFRVDPTENYVILERGYLGKDDYAIVVKDLNTKEDVFALQMKDVLAKYPDLEGNFGMNEWTKDGKYFWGNIFDGANVLAFFRIETGTWKTDILPAPDDILGGDALNAEKDLITVHPGNVWYGFEDETQQEIAKRRAQGIGTELYIYNLFTKSKQFVASTTEPLWYFKPKWLSDTELEYEIPNGEKRVFKTK